MKIGLHPYTYDPAANLKAALGLFRREGIAALIRCAT